MSALTPPAEAHLLKNGGRLAHTDSSFDWDAGSTTYKKESHAADLQIFGLGLRFKALGELDQYAITLGNMHG